MKTMKTIKIALAALLLLPVVAVAEMRIAVMDPFAAIAETSEFKSRAGKIEADMKAKEAELLKLRNEVMDLEQKLQKDGLTMSKDEQKNLTDQRDAKMLDLRSRSQLAQKRLEEDRNEMMALMEPRLKQAIDKIAADGKFDLIITRQAVLFAAEKTDITRDVTQIMNQMK